MSLCKTCQSIDLLNVPKLPASCNLFHASNKSSSLISVTRKRASQAVADQGVDEILGQPFHQSLEELKLAATDCSVCKVVEHDVDSFQAAFAEDQEEQLLRRSKGPNWKMWLAKGKNDVSGFMVVSVDAEKESVVWVLSAVGLCVDDEDPLSDVVAGRRIEADASSGTTIQRASNWIQQCDAEHTGTRCAVTDKALPPRVLDVNDTASGVFALHTSQGEVGKYAALSHAWDTGNPYTTTSSDLETHENGVDLASLPKTFQAAITITRKLGLQYLWIDTLCIHEKDLPKWSRSSSPFATIYSNAYIILAATGSPDDMLTTRSPPPYVPFPHTHNTTRGTIHVFSLPKEPTLYPSNYRVLYNEPLSHRGWALQERLFSARILHFGSKQLYFECYKHFLSEDGFRMIGREDTLYPDTKTESANVSSANFLWHDILQLYCRRTLPRSSDKLPALSNLAAFVAEKTGDTYVAGLWRANLIEGLIWQATGHGLGRTSEAVEYRAPSWSWANTDGPFGTFCLGHGPDGGEWKDVAQVLDCQVTLKGEDPFGEVKDAWIKLKAPLEPLSMCDKEPRMQGSWMKTRSGSESGAYCIFDTRARAERARGLKLEAMLLTKRARGGSEVWDYHGIVVAGVAGKEGIYERMGKVVFDDETLGECEWMKDGGKLVDVMLV